MALSSNAPLAPSAGASPLDEFIAAVRTALDARSPVSIVVSKNRRAGDDLASVRIRLIELRGAPALSFVYRHATRDVTRNLAPEAGLAALTVLFDDSGGPRFAQASAQLPGQRLQLMVGRRGTQTLRRFQVGEPADRLDIDEEHAPPVLPGHDRAKVRALSLELPFLVDLGITDERHRLVPSMARKWKQIDKFLQVLDAALEAAPPDSDTPLRVVDFGSGKGYLTFAVHEHLRQCLGIAPQVTGVELRGDLVDLCNRAAERSRCEGLRFVQGDLRSFVPEAVDIMIALHACDTATDHALELGLRAGARILVCSPCCHKELRPQMQRPAPLGALFRHGVHLAQEAEMLTDSLRALLLEAAGYEAKVFEFVALEHTNKNKMILATRRDAGSDAKERALAQVAELKTFYGIREQCLERLLRERAEARLTSTERS